MKADSAAEGKSIGSGALIDVVAAVLSQYHAPWSCHPPPGTRLNRIPRLLHQTWKSKSDIPQNYAFWCSSFLECNPGLERRLYDDRDNRVLLAESFPGLLPLYDAFPREIFRADFIRPVYLFQFGGVYADMDYQCLQSLDEVFSTESGIVLGLMGRNDFHINSIPNALMLSRPRQGFWLGYLALIEEAWSREPDKPGARRPDLVTGPVVLRRAVFMYRGDRAAFRRMVDDFVVRHQLGVAPESLEYDDLQVLSGGKLYPLDWNNPEHFGFKADMLQQGRLYSVAEARSMFPGSLAVTYWTHSWNVPRPKGRRKPWWARMASKWQGFCRIITDARY